MKPKPSTGFEVERIPLAMRDAPRWVNWQAVERNGDWTKEPIDPKTLRLAKSNDSTTWSTFDDAIGRRAYDLGIGFMLGDGWLGVDLDNIVDPSTDQINNPDVEEWLLTTDSYVETTPSKTGLHVIFEGVKIPEWSQNRRDFVEVYADKRYFTVTGHARFTNREITPDQAAVDSLCDKWLRKDKPKPTSPVGAKRKRNTDNSADDYALACDLARKGTPRAEIEAKLVEKMRAEGRDEKAARADYVPRTVDAAERAVEADPTPLGAKTADKLVALALDRFELGCTPKRETFAVEKTGANVAIRLHGEAMKSTLSSLYFEEYASVAGSAALEDSLAVLRGQAKKTEPRELAIRYGRDGDKIVVDLGRVDGKSVEIDAAGWRVVDRSPILFERTELVGQLPIPTSDGTVEDLRSLLNVSDADFDVIVGWIVAAMIPEIQHPILFCSGGEGTGKTTAAVLIVGVLDPSDAPKRVQPRDLENYVLSIAGSWTAVLDNVSKIPEWLSDALCMTVSGASFAKRTLYSDCGLTVVNFRRALAITTIDAGEIRGDLASRFVKVDFEPIEDVQTKDEQDVRRRIDEIRAPLFGAFCGLLSKTLAAHPHVRLDRRPRMASFARVLAAVDSVRGTRSLATYLGQRERLADDVVEGDPVGSAVAEWLEASAGTVHTLNMKELRRALTAHDGERADRLPRTDKGLGGVLRRLASSLRLHGLTIAPPRPTDKLRKWTLSKAQTAQPPETRTDGDENAVDPRAIPF